MVNECNVIFQQNGLWTFKQEVDLMPTMSKIMSAKVCDPPSASQTSAVVSATRELLLAM